ncbi:MAG: PAS domain S-box protein, partial [Jatrophihabitans sp.]
MHDQRDAADLLACQNRVLELVSRGASRTVLLDCITRGLERLIPGSRCSVLVMDRGNDALRHGSAPSLPASYLAAIDGLVPGPEAGSCGSAAYLGEPVVAVDIDTDRRWDSYRASAAAAGLRACWSTPIRGAAGAVVGTFAVYHDVPHSPSGREQRVVEQLSYLAGVAIEHAAMFRALSESEERFRRAFEDNAIAMALVDAAGRFTRVNDALVRLTGVPAERLADVTLADVVAPGERARLQACIDQVRFGRERSRLLESRIRRPADQDAIVSLTMSLVRGAEDEPVQLSVNMLDVTERIAAQEERRARHEAELARRGAEAASRAKSQFLSAMSHEMRTPLQAITGFVELLTTLPLDATRRDEALRHINAGARHLLELVDDSLDLARIEAGALPLTLRDLPVATAVGEVLDLLAPLAGQHAVHLVAEPIDAWAVADDRRLRQVLINLVSNAISYGGSGGSVTVAAGRDGDLVRITVTDHGPGIAADLGERLFEPFFVPESRRDRRADPEGRAAPGAGGIGLGLMLARGLSEVMGGRLELSAADGGGT